MNKKLPIRTRLHIIREVWAVLKAPSGYVKYGQDGPNINEHKKRRWGKYARTY